MKIYFAGSIRGGRKDVKQYALIIEILKKYGQVLTEHIGDYKISKFGEKGVDENKIFKRDLKWLHEADVLVAEASIPSLGVSYEIAIAEKKFQKILCLYREQKGKKLSTMIVGNSKIVVKKYITIAEVKKIIDSFFRNIKKTKKKKLLTRQLCKKCSQNQESCCTYYVPLTFQDIKKIIKLGFNLKESTEISRYTKDELLGEEDWWVKNLILVNNQSCRLTTRLTKENKCFFLKDKKGCVLGKNRPTECKLFPFWFEKNKLVYQDDSCYLVRREVPRDEILKIIGENKKSIKRHFLAIKNDFVKNKKIHQIIIKKLLKK